MKKNNENAAMQPDSELLKSAKRVSRKKSGISLTIVFSIISLVYVFPVLAVVVNSFKTNTYVKTDTFMLPINDAEHPDIWAGFSNFINGMTFGEYPFVKSVIYSVIITMVYCTCRFFLLQGHLLPLCICNGSAFPDGNVYTFKNCRYSASEYSVDHSYRILRFWRRSCNIYVRWFCKVNTDRNRRSSCD